jgi:hypothetical protein
MDSVKAFYKQTEVKFVNLMFSLFWIYNYLFVLAEERFKHYGFLKKYFIVSNQLVEPQLDTWNCITTVNMNLDQPKLIEQYRYGSEEEYNQIISNIVLEKETLFIRKSEKYRLSRVSVPNLEKPVFDEIPNPNNTRFLNIMYFHKDMKNPLKINLDLTYIRNGNEVFSKTFVYRMLSYQYNPGDYQFDETYELHLMDDKINKHTLRACDYIFFNDRLKAGYEVRKL